MIDTSLHLLSAFTGTPTGGNPAGVWIGAELPDPQQMRSIAAKVGFSETAFLAPIGPTRFLVRYYSPQAEVPFCGHATIAAGVQLGRLHGAGGYEFDTAVGDVRVDVREVGGGWEASLVSVPTRHSHPAAALLSGVLDTIGWSTGDLDPAISPAVAFAGANHLLLTARSRERLGTLDYDFDTLRQLMLDAELTTVALLWREATEVFHARNAFPVGGIMEDPATGAAAAALGGYLRDAGLVRPPAKLLVRQGEAMGRPSRITVSIPATGGIVVSGRAVALPPDATHPDA